MIDVLLASITKSCSRQLMQTTFQSSKPGETGTFSDLISRYALDLRKTVHLKTIIALGLVIHELNSRLYIDMKSVKDKKFASLCNKQLPSQMNNNIMSLNEKLVVTIPGDLVLTDAEKSVLGKGLTFVPVEKNI
ncbi:hypothetical protein OS493_025623 [Desmophyllum pertusum]|uniref:Uncharacterized protein n=1 Tax=Desmophyllum pertusum TaxID=174260 RepID=A0A9X0D7L7_9CNID|nr:hypothetical protein OS493_025623 [Desmophyllum pertusum]